MAELTVDEFLDTQKVHNRCLDACFNDALAVSHLRDLINKEQVKLLESKDNAYHERDQLVAALSKLYPAWLGYHEGKDWEDDWRNIVYIRIPSGQVSWHIHDSEKPLFSHLDPGLEKWDGHTTEQKYSRLTKLKGE